MRENGVCLVSEMRFIFFLSLSACTDEQGADNEPTVAKLYGEELHKIKVFEAADAETKKTDLPVARDTEKQQFNLYVDVENKEEVSGQVPPVMGTICADRLTGKQSNWMRNDDKIDGVITASSEALPKLSHTNPSLVSLQQQNHITCLIIQPRG